MSACTLGQESSTATAQPGTSIALEVNESFSLGDTPVLLLSAIVIINESFSVGDEPMVLASSEEEPDLSDLTDEERDRFIDATGKDPEMDEVTEENKEKAKACFEEEVKATDEGDKSEAVPRLESPDFNPLQT